MRFEGGRQDRVRRSRTPIADAEIAGNGANSVGILPFTPQFHAGLRFARRNYEVVPGWRAGLSLSHSERAPSVDELYSRGPHGGSQPFLFGGPDLSETSNSANSTCTTWSARCTSREASITAASTISFSGPDGRRPGRPAGLRVSSGQSRISRFRTGQRCQVREGAGNRLGRRGRRRRRARDHPQLRPRAADPAVPGAGRTDRTRGQVDGRRRSRARLRPGRTAPNETPTPGFTLVNASFDWHPFSANPELTLIAAGQQPIRRRSPAARQLSQRLCAALRPRHSPVRANEFLGPAHMRARSGCYTAGTLNKKRRPGKDPDRLHLETHLGRESFPAGLLNIDTGGDRLELADSFLEVRHLDPPAGGGKARSPVA